MVSGKYSALSGAITREQNMSTISENLANVTTPGYKKSGMSFEAMLRGEKQLVETRGINYNRVSSTYVEYSQGALQQTEDPFHFALVGNGFFKVRGPNKDLLTRNGTFILDSNGTLVTDRGRTVLSAGGGEISVPNANTTKIIADEEGRIFSVDVDGNRVEIAQLAIVDVADRSTLVREDDTSFSLGAGAAEINPENMRLVQGSFEISNVNMTVEMSRMIRDNRYYASYHNMLKGYSNLSEKLEELGTLS